MFAEVQSGRAIIIVQRQASRLSVANTPHSLAYQRTAGCELMCTRARRRLVITRSAYYMVYRVNTMLTCARDVLGSQVPCVKRRESSGLSTISNDYDEAVERDIDADLIGQHSGTRDSSNET